jgi:hypothetical protein
MLAEVGGFSTDFLSDLLQAFLDICPRASDGGRFLAPVSSVAGSHKFVQEGLLLRLELFHAAAIIVSFGLFQLFLKITKPVLVVTPRLWIDLCIGRPVIAY